ncbi:RasGEF domain containing protein, putative [Entamoeba histolytica]
MMSNQPCVIQPSPIPSKKRVSFAKKLEGIAETCIRELSPHSPRSTRPGFLSSRTSFTPKKPRTGFVCSTSVFGQTMENMIIESYQPEQLIKEFKNHSYQLISNLDYIFVKQRRVALFHLEPEKRRILQKLCSDILKNKITKEQLLTLTFSDENIHDENCKAFLDDIIQNQSTLFQLEGDPLFDSDGSIVECSSEELWSLALDPFLPDYLTSIFVYVAPLFTTLEFIVDHLQIEQMYCDNNPRLDEERFKKLQKIRDIALSAPRCYTKIPAKIQKQMTEIFTTNNTPRVLVNEIRGALRLPSLPEKMSALEEFATVRSNSLYSSRRSYKLRRGMATSLRLSETGPHPKQDEEEEKGTPSIQITQQYEDMFFLFKEKSSVIARQLALFDQKLIKRVEKYDLAKEQVDKCKSVQQYIDNLQRIEEFFLDITKDKKSLEKVIKLGCCCSDINEMNMAHLIFSVLVRRSIDLSEQFKSLRKERKEEYNKLYSLFSIDKNNAIYRNRLKIIPPTEARIIVFSLWMKDMISLQEINVHLGDHLNINRLRLSAMKINEFIICQNEAFMYEENEEIQNYFMSL